MQENKELTTADIVDDDAPLLPDGWKEGDNIFQEDSWSGGEDQSGQTDPAAEDQPADDADDPGTTALTMGEEKSTDDGQSDEGTEQAGQSGQTETPAKPSRILKLKVNHGKQDTEVDINAMSDEELISLLQKGHAFDAMRDNQMKEKYRQVYQDQVYKGMTEEAARMVAANACDGKTYPLEDPAETPAPDPTTTAASVHDLREEITKLKVLFPDFTEMPEEVVQATQQGVDLLTAYAVYRSRNTAKAAASLKKENEVLKQNAASAAKAPVRGVTGGGSTAQKEDPWLKAFDAGDLW